METEAIKHLADALASIQLARKATRNGIADDHCVNAVRELRHALDGVVEFATDDRHDSQ